MKKITFFVILCATLVACGGNKDEAMREAALKDLDKVAAERAQEVHLEPEQLPQATTQIEPKGPTTKMDFMGKDKFKFGTVKEGEKVVHDFEFVNAGDQPLIITSCKASCGCTVPEWNKAPIPPKGKDKIHVVFDTNHKTGTQVKAITITANTEPTRSSVALVGEVTPANK